MLINIYILLSLIITYVRIDYITYDLVREDINKYSPIYIISLS